MIDSNYFTLKYYRLPPSEREKRLQYLENTIKQLEAYHSKARPAKRPIIACLIAKYDELITSLS